jgi:hypothetical protein
LSTPTPVRVDRAIDASRRFEEIRRAFTDRDWRPDPQRADGLFAELLPIAETVSEAVAWRMQCQHVDVYASPAADAAAADEHRDLLHEELAELQAQKTTPYRRWLELHQAGHGSATDRMCVLRHLVRTAT